MWRQFYDFAKQILCLNEQTATNTEDIKELRQELKDLSAVVQRLSYEVHRNLENEAHEREKLMLRLENTLLKFERRLPPHGKATEQDEE